MNPAPALAPTRLIAANTPPSEEEEVEELDPPASSEPVGVLRLSERLFEVVSARWAVAWPSRP